VTAAATVALLTVTAAGCGGSSTNSSAESAFLRAVHLADPNINTYRSDTELVRLGHAACDGFRAGASYQELADRLALEEGSNALPSQDLGDVITSAVDGLCPQFRSLVSAAAMTDRTGRLPIDARVRET
jgi:hypothetical protein